MPSAERTLGVGSNTLRTAPVPCPPEFSPGHESHMSWAAGTPKADQPGTAGPTETKACRGSWAYTLVFPGSRKMLPCSESSLASLTRSKNSHPSPPPPGELSPGLPWPWLLAEAVPESNQPRSYPCVSRPPWDLD